MKIAKLLLLPLLLIGAVASAQTDDDFHAAREAFRVNDTRRLDVLAPKLKGHVLEPYGAYWQLRSRLDTADTETIRAFLEQYRGTFVAQRMRADWLKLLGKNQQWELFQGELPLLVNDDVEITCYALQARARTDATAIREARSLWFTSKDTPASCTPLFSALAASGQLSEQDIWTRVRLALQAGQVGVAARVSGHLPAGQAPNAGVLSAISSNPGGYLARQQFDTATRAGRETAMFAAYRLARTSPRQAADHWSRIEARFNAEERGVVWGEIGHQGALRHDPDTLAWYSRASGMNDLQLEWKGRAALRAGNWKEVLAAVDAMTHEQHDSPWRYWKARALKTMGREAEALALLKPLSQEFLFYGQLALEDLGGKITAPPVTYTPSAADIQAMSQDGGIRRALALFRLGLRAEATREWVWVIRDFDDRKLITAAEIARRNDINDRAINTADKTTAQHDFRLRYLAPHRDLLKQHAARFDLDEAWVLGLIRQESRFITDIRSSAGASGLMQLMPGTAQWVAGRLGLKNWRWGNVNDIDTNLSLGTYYLRHVYDYLDNSPVLASAAYNAGPGRARAWRPNVNMDAAIFAENIPFNETRHYVKLVMANASYYANLFTQQPQSLRQRIGEITARRPDEKGLGDTP